MFDDFSKNNISVEDIFYLLNEELDQVKFCITSAKLNNIINFSCFKQFKSFCNTMREIFRYQWRCYKMTTFLAKYIFIFIKTIFFIKQTISIYSEKLMVLFFLFLILIFFLIIFLSLKFFYVSSIN